MGTKQASKTRYIYEVDENFNVKEMGYYVTFEETPFNKGTFRYCYKGKIEHILWKRPFMDKYFSNDQCVAKVFRNKVAEEKKDLYKNFKTYFYSQNVSQIFNSKYEHYNIPKLDFITPYATSLEEHASFNLLFFYSIKSYDQMQKIKENEWIIIEPFIKGKYEKFTNNADCIEPNIDKTIPFFMHWNWAYSKGEKLVTDIQGVRKKSNYVLTDPAVQSIDKEYGEGDLGICGLILFLYKHKHNEYCRDLPWPSDKQFKKIKEIVHDKRFCKESSIYKEDYIKILNSTFNNYTYLLFLPLIIIIFIFIFIYLKKIYTKNENTVEKEKNN